MIGPWTSTLGILVLLFSILGLKYVCKRTGKIPVDCLLDMRMHCIRSEHQACENSWSFFVYLFVCQNPYQAELWANEWFLSFFSQLFWCCVHCRNQTKEGGYFNLLTPAVSANVWCTHRETYTLETDMACLWHLLLFYTLGFIDAVYCYLTPQFCSCLRCWVGRLHGLSYCFLMERQA